MRVNLCLLNEPQGDTSVVIDRIYVPQYPILPNFSLPPEHCNGAIHTKGETHMNTITMSSKKMNETYVRRKGKINRTAA